MTWPQYRHIITQIKTAVRSNINPSAVMFNERPKAKPDWSVYDVKLLEAFEMLEEQTCGYCHQPRWICDAREDANWLTFTADIGFCKGKEAKDSWDEAESKMREKDKSQLGKGQFVNFIPKVDGGFMYPEVNSKSRPDRRGWLKQLEEAAKLADPD